MVTKSSVAVESSGTPQADAAAIAGSKALAFENEQFFPATNRASPYYKP